MSFWDQFIPPIFKQGSRTDNNTGIAPQPSADAYRLYGAGLPPQYSSQQFQQAQATPQRGVQVDGVQMAPQAYAASYPWYEITTPAYPNPTPYNLAQEGYMRNEVVYSCIQARAMAVAEARLTVYKRLSKTDPTKREENYSHPLNKVLANPNEAMTTVEFLQALIIFLDIAGFTPWEMEFNNGGEPIALWPMRPDWCSTYRGVGRPIRAVRYQPYGLPPMDVPIERVQMFMEFNPIFPMLKGFSRTAAALRIIGVDNNATDVINTFFKRGAFLGGLLKTEQALNDAEAQRIRDRWRTQHGGPENAGDMAVLGQGVEYKPTSTSFRDMEFPEIDARSEARICQTYRVPPIVIGANVGLSHATLSNFQESNRAFHQFTILPLWHWVANQITEQQKRIYDEDDLVVDFDTSEVKALQEDRTAVWTRAGLAASQNLIIRDEARVEMGLDPIDNGAKVFVGMNPPAVGEETVPGPTPEELAAQNNQDNQDNGDNQDNTPGKNGDNKDAEVEAKRFRAFAEKRIREGKPDEIALFKFYNLSPDEQGELLDEVGIAAKSPFRWEDERL